MSNRKSLGDVAKHAVERYANCVAENIRRVSAGGAADEKAEDRARQAVDKAIEALAASN